MKTVYVVAIKCLKDWSGNIVNRWEYAFTDFEVDRTGSYACWNAYLADSNQFDTAELAEKWFCENKKNIQFYHSIDDYDMKSVCIKKVFISEPIYKFEKNLSF